MWFGRQDSLSSILIKKKKKQASKKSKTSLYGTEMILPGPTQTIFIPLTAKRKHLKFQDVSQELIISWSDWRLVTHFGEASFHWGVIIIST